jgi:hypothetical protein
MASTDPAATACAAVVDPAVVATSVDSARPDSAEGVAAVWVGATVSVRGSAFDAAAESVVVVDSVALSPAGGAGSPG